MLRIKHYVVVLFTRDMDVHHKHKAFEGLALGLVHLVMWIMHYFDDVKKKSLDCHHQKGGECECMNT